MGEEKGQGTGCIGRRLVHRQGRLEVGRQRDNLREIDDTEQACSASLWCVRSTFPSMAGAITLVAVLFAVLAVDDPPYSVSSCR